MTATCKDYGSIGSIRNGELFPDLEFLFYNLPMSLVTGTLKLFLYMYVFWKVSAILCLCMTFQNSHQNPTYVWPALLLLYFSFPGPLFLITSLYHLHSNFPSCTTVFLSL